MTRKILVGALMSTLVLGMMTAGVRAGDNAGRAPSADQTAFADRAESLVPNGLLGRRAGCDTLRCINRTFRQIIRALNGICVLPITVYGNQANDTSAAGYSYDTNNDGTPDINTSAIDITDAGQTPGFMMLIDCP